MMVGNIVAKDHMQPMERNTREELPSGEVNHLDILDVANRFIFFQVL